MAEAAARAEPAGGEGRLHGGRLVLAGLPIDLELRGSVGVAEAWAQIAPHLQPPDDGPVALAPESVGRPVLPVLLRAHPGHQPRFDTLSVRQRGERLLCEGDGLRGELGPGGAELDVYGGAAALLTAMRLCAAVWLPQRGGLLLHGACVEVDGGALAFLGPSGAGKTTLARRLAARAVRVVSDEVSAVRLARLHGHPFPRRLGDGTAPVSGLALRGLGFLSHATAGAAPRVRPLPEREAAAALLSRVFLPVRTPALLEAVLTVAWALVQQVHCAALALPDDDRAAGLALALRGGL